VREDEWDAVADRIFNNQSDFAGVSLLPATGDLDYPQAPFQACHGPGDREAIRARFAALKAAWVDLDFTTMYESEDGTTLLDNVACAGGACLI
jgi:ribonucleoside-triphosphate reductase